MTTIKCVSFDVDDTLWDFAAMMRTGIAAIVEQMSGIGYTDVTVDGLLDQYHAATAGHDPAVMKWTELRRRVFRDILAEHGHTDPEAASQELISLYVGVWKDSVTLYPGVYETLDALKGRSLKMAWATNGNFGPDEVVAAFPPYFDVVAMPHLVGTSKPDPAFLQYVADKAGCQPGEVMHVGDSLRSDVGAAVASGAVAVWFNPNGLINEGDQVPDYTINHLTEVLDLLA